MAELLTADAAVIGAGCAGLAAAARLAARGARVVVIEQAPRIGGRTASFSDRESGERVDNGQHVLFGCYRDTYALLRQIGAEDRAPLERNLDMIIAGGPDGRGHRLHVPDLPSPWHLALGLLMWDAVPVGARLAVRHFGSLLSVARSNGPAAAAETVDPSLTVTEWLLRMQQDTAIRRWLWTPLAFAALNQSPDDASARMFARVMAELFGADPRSAAVGLPRVPLDELLALPAVTFVEERGGALLSRRPARVVTAGGRVAHVRVGDAVVRAPVVISAVPWHAFAAIWDEQCPAALADIAKNAAAMRATPIVTVNLWFDRDIMERGVKFMGISDGTMQWLFDRASITGDGGHISAVCSGAIDVLKLENDAIVARAEADVRRVLPAAARAALVRALVVREPRAGFSVAPSAPPRPSTVTALPGFLLAGDWTDTGLPATIEGAVRSGFAAADAAR